MWEKRKKLYYVPGLISALILPVIFYFKKPVIKEQVAVNLFVPSDQKIRKELGFRFSSIWLLNEFKKKKVVTIALDDNHEQNEDKLIFLRHEARKIIFYNDASTVIRVSFSDETTYQEVIDLLNIILADKHPRFAVIGNDFYLFGDIPSDPPPKRLDYL